MEFIFLIALLVLAVVSMNRTSTLRGEIERLEATIRALVERLGTSGAPAAAAAATTGDTQTAPRTELAPETSLRDAAAVEPAPALPTPGPPVTAAETVPTARPAAFNADEIPARFRDEPLPQSGVIDSAEQPPAQPPTEPPPPELRHLRRSRRSRIFSIWSNSSAPNWWSGSAVSRWRSAAFSWCATRSSRACSARGCASSPAPCSRCYWSVSASWRAARKTHPASTRCRARTSRAF